MPINHSIVCVYFRDVAARNCLVENDLNVKIGDYGFSVETYQVRFLNLLIIENLFAFKQFFIVDVTHVIFFLLE